MNPCKYVVAILEGAGMRDDDICLSVEIMIRHYIEKLQGESFYRFQN